MSFTVCAITLDLDDTLWPFAPIGARIEQAIHDWMLLHSPRTARMFPIPAMRALRERIFADNADLAHDVSALRRRTLAHALRESGADLSLLEPAFEAFYAARNQVECYPDSLDALQRIAARMPVAAITNGNADLQRIGLAGHFAFQLGACEHGAAKPDPGIFLAACTRLGCLPGEVLHVGDHVETDVAGAARAGLRACWLNRVGARWEREDLRPDLEFVALTELADWLEAQAREDDCLPGAAYTSPTGESPA